jgi:NADPH:quinone reductase-like Zn-dependent oxidoreductase
VVGSSTDAHRRGRLKEFGADLAVDSSDPGWVDQVLKATNGEGVDLIVDQVSGKVMNQNLAATKIKGRIVNVGRLGGTRAEFNFDLQAARRITMSASPSAPAPSRKSAKSSTKSAKTSGAPSNRASCNCRSTRSTSSTRSEQRSSTWRPTSTSGRLL